VESAWFWEVKPCVECSIRVLRSELTKLDIEQTSVEMVFEHFEFGDNISKRRVSNVNSVREGRDSIRHIYLQLDHIIVEPNLG